VFDKKPELERQLLLKVAEEAVRAAGAHLLRGFGTSPALSAPDKTGSRSAISSVYDKLSNQILLEALLEGFFRYESDDEVAVISEELKVPVIAKRGDKAQDFAASAAQADLARWRKYSWVVDPLCGSIPYARGVADFIVSVCLMEGRSRKIGVVYDPVRDELFSAVRGQGARLNGRPIAPSAIRVLAKAYVSVEHKVFRIIAGNKTRKLAQAIQRLRVAGTCGLELCYVACGRVDALIKMNQPLYDYAAGALILSESLGNAGKQTKSGLTDLKGDSLKPTLDLEKNTNILGTNGAVHSALRGITANW